jgi:AcrR family transcriptional regulator
MSRTKRQVVAEFRHAEILDAGRHVFAVRGFERASVDEIARRAGVAKGTVYLYYPSKQRLYQAALRHDLLALVAELRERMAAAGSLKDRVRAFIETKLRFFGRNREFFRIYQAAFAPGQPIQCHKDFAGLYRKQIALLEAAFREASGRERLRRVSAPAAALAVFDLTRGVIQRRVFGRKKGATKRDVDFVIELTWKGLSGR